MAFKSHVFMGSCANIEVVLQAYEFEHFVVHCFEVQICRKRLFRASRQSEDSIQAVAAFCLYELYTTNV
jgi:hypothetical protein